MNVVEYVRLGLRYRQDPFYIKYLKGRRVLDIGSGEGAFLVRDPANFVGVDIDPGLVNQCKKLGLQAHYMSAFSLEFSDASFDAIHAAQLIEHFSPTEAVQFLSEASRVLRPGGVIFLTTPGICNVWATFSHIRPYPPEAFQKLLDSRKESYIRVKQLDLLFEKAWGFRLYSEKKAIMFSSCIVDLLMAPRNPIGWTIILRKKW